MMLVLRSEPGIFSATLVTGLATGFGTFRCHGSMLKLFGSACVVCATTAAQGSDSTAVSTRILISFPLSRRVYGRLREFTNLRGRASRNPGSPPAVLAYSFRTRKQLARVEALYA